MASRSRLPPHHLIHPAPPPPSSLIASLESRIAAQHRDIQSLLIDNQHLAATHVALKQDLSSSHLDLRALADSSARKNAERDSQVRETFERAIKAEDEARRVEAMRAELGVVRSDVGMLGKARDELVEKLETLKAELGRVRGESGRVEEVKAEIEIMRKEIERGRAAVEYEKKAHADNLEQSQAMEKNMVSMAREVEKLRAELANAKKRARAAAAAVAKPGQGYAETYGNSEMAYGGSSYSDTYGLHQAQRGVDAGSQYGSGAVSRGPYDIQQTHVYR